MKILHVAETIRGGVATVIRHNIVAQAKKFEPENVLALVPDTQEQDLDEAKQFTGFSFKRTGRNVGSFMALTVAFFKKVRKERPDVIHLHSSFAGVICRVMLIPIRLSAPSYKPVIVYCPHAFGFLMEGKVWKKKIYAFVEWLLQPLTDAIICVSHYERDEGMKFGLSDKKLKVVYNGVPVPEPAKDGGKEDSEITQLLFLGRLDFQKGFDLMLEAMEALEGEAFHLTVVGEALKSEVQPPERANITYVGWVAADEVGGYINACDVMVMPSRWEGFAMVPLEAMAQERAVAASNFGAMDELVSDGKNGKLFPVGNIFEMVRILRETPKEQWLAMGKEARKCVKDNFSDEQMTRETIKLYYQLILQNNA